MPDRRQVLRGLLLAGAGVALSSCGVPTGGAPVVDGTGPPYDPISGQQVKPPNPSDADAPTALVELFLAAISGPLDTTELRAAARDRARSFLTGDAVNSWQPNTEAGVTVVRAAPVRNTTGGPDVTTVTYSLQPVALLDTAHGYVKRLDPDTPSAPAQLDFSVVFNADRSGYLIQKLPDTLPAGLLLSTAALDEQFYLPQLIYFWDSAKHGLVPDLRYVPRTGEPASRQMADIVNWLIAGPTDQADLISRIAVNTMPEGTQLQLPNLVTEGDRLVVSLTPTAEPADLAKVMSQLRWSLQPLYPLSGSVQLQIGSRPQQVDGSSTPFIADNPADAETRDPEPKPFYIVGGQVVAVESGYPVPPVLTSAQMPVEQAAVSRDGRQSALVGNKGMVLGTTANKSGSVTYVDSGLTGQRFGRPAFLPSGKRVLVVVDGVLYAVTGPRVFTPLLPEKVTAFSVSPDGYRIAVIGHDGLQIGVVRDTGDQLSVTFNANQPPLDPGLTDLNGVAWTRLDRVIVSGRRSDLFALTEVSIDGVIVSPWATPLFPAPIESVVAYPKLPSQPRGSGPVLVQVGNEAYRVFANSSPNPLRAPAQSPSPKPSASGTGSASSTPNPIAPFYVD